MLTNANVDGARRTKCDHNSSPCILCIGELKTNHQVNLLISLITPSTADLLYLIFWGCILSWLFTILLGPFILMPANANPAIATTLKVIGMTRLRIEHVTSRTRSGRSTTTPSRRSDLYGKGLKLIAADLFLSGDNERSRRLLRGRINNKTRISTIN